MDEEEEGLFTDVPDTVPPPKEEEPPPAFAKKQKAKVQRSAATPALAKKEKAKIQRSAAPGADQRTKKVLEPALEKIVEVEKIVTKEVPVDRLVVVEVPIKRLLCMCVCDCVCVCVFVHYQSSGKSSHFHTDIHEGRNHSEKLVQKQQVLTEDSVSVSLYTQTNKVLTVSVLLLDFSPFLPPSIHISRSPLSPPLYFHQHHTDSRRKGYREDSI
jgi:hypothetical protein